jgi:hypothetical protein
MTDSLDYLAIQKRVRALGTLRHVADDQYVECRARSRVHGNAACVGSGH